MTDERSLHLDKFCAALDHQFSNSHIFLNYQLLAMTLASLLFALLLALLLGATFHFVRAGGGWNLILDLTLSVLGFAAGHFLAIWRGWTLYRFGALDLGAATAGGLVLLLIGDWLSRLPPSDTNSV